MEIVDLSIRQRKETGKQANGRLRRQGKIPAILYGHGMDPLALEVDQREFYRVIHTKAGENVLIRLKTEGLTLAESTCRIKDMQHDPVNDQINHVDFTIISLTEKITVMVPVHIKNAEDAAGVKEGGVLDVVHHELEIECLPTEIPENITFDIKAMKINDSLCVKDIQGLEKVSFSLEPQEVIVAIHPPRKDEVEKPAEEVTQPEVIEKGKKPEETEEGAAAEA